MGATISRTHWPSQSPVAGHVRFSGCLRPKQRGQQGLS